MSDRPTTRLIHADSTEGLKGSVGRIQADYRAQWHDVRRIMVVPAVARVSAQRVRRAVRRRRRPDLESLLVRALINRVRCSLAFHTMAKRAGGMIVVVKAVAIFAFVFLLVFMVARPGIRPAPIRAV